MRHKWTPVVKDYGHETSVCKNCGLRRIQRMHGGFHWTEWQLGKDFLNVTKTPPCVVEKKREIKKR